MAFDRDGKWVDVHDAAKRVIDILDTGGRETGGEYRDLIESYGHKFAKEVLALRTANAELQKDYYRSYDQWAKLAANAEAKVVELETKLRVNETDKWIDLYTSEKKRAEQAEQRAEKHLETLKLLYQEISESEADNILDWCFERVKEALSADSPPAKGET